VATFWGSSVKSVKKRGRRVKVKRGTRDTRRRAPKQGQPTEKVKKGPKKITRGTLKGSFRSSEGGPFLIGKTGRGVEKRAFIPAVCERGRGGVEGKV